MLSISVKNLFEKPFAVEEIFHKRRAFFMSFFRLGFSSPFALDRFFRWDIGVDAGVIEIGIVISGKGDEHRTDHAHGRSPFRATGMEYTTSTTQSAISAACRLIAASFRR